MSEPFVGEIRMFAGNFAPRSWAFCDGQLLSVSQNDALFSLLGTIYGGDGRTTFGLPEMRGRIPVHAGFGPGLSPRSIGAKGGLERVNISTNQLPAHSHNFQATSNSANVNAPAGALLAQTQADIYLDNLDDGSTSLATESVSSTGGSQSHSNLMPFQCVNFIIALFGVYPSRT